MSRTVLFYSPIKRPFVGAASGLPRVASLMMEALTLAGYRVACPDLPLTYDGGGDPERQKTLRGEAENAAAALIADMRPEPDRPAAWFTYHCYYKSPDMIGPIVSKALGCPYVIAEGSYARKRANGPWAEHHRAAELALAAADVLLVATERDREGLAGIPGRFGQLRDFPPFIDVEPFKRVERTAAPGSVRLLAAGSMTGLRKVQSYRVLFAALARLGLSGVTLTIAGDGVHRSRLESEAESVRASGIRVTFLGQVPHARMPEFFSTGEIFAWPGVGEAYGLTYLEAQAAGLPVVAMESGGVPACVRDGVSGILSAPDDPDAFAQALARMIADEDFRRSLGRAARQWVLADRSLTMAAKRVEALIREAGQ